MDLKEEREIAVQTLMKLDCIPSGMEQFPAADIEQFEFIKKIIDDCDYYLLIIGGKYGSMTEEGISYTEKEYDYAIKKGIKVIAYLHENPEQLLAKNSEQTQEAIEKLNNFRDKVSNNRLVEFWQNKDQLAGMIALGITSLRKMYPAVGWIRADKVSSSESLTEINELRKENESLLQRLNTLSNNLNSMAKMDIENLAELDDLVCLNGKYSISTEPATFLPVKRDWSLKIKLSDIFIGLAPKCENYLHESSALDILQETISKLAYVKIEDEKKSLLPGASTADECILKVKYQFKALGLIAISELKSTSGTMEIYWKLTEKGVQIMMEQITFKRLV